MRLAQRFYFNKMCVYAFLFLMIFSMSFFLISSLLNLFVWEWLCMRVCVCFISMVTRNRSTHKIWAINVSKWNLRGRAPNLTDFIQIYTTDCDSFAIYNNYDDDADDCCCCLWHKEKKGAN